METLLTNFYTHALWSLFLANSNANGVEVTQSLQFTLNEFWNGNVNANVPAEDLPSATLQNLYELAHGDDAGALASIKSTL